MPKSPIDPGVAVADADVGLEREPHDPRDGRDQQPEEMRVCELEAHLPSPPNPTLNRNPNLLFGVRWLDTALDFERDSANERDCVLGMESGVKPPHSKRWDVSSTNPTIQPHWSSELPAAIVAKVRLNAHASKEIDNVFDIDGLAP